MKVPAQNYCQIHPLLMQLCDLQGSPMKGEYGTQNIPWISINNSFKMKTCLCDQVVQAFTLLLWFPWMCYQTYYS